MKYRKRPVVIDAVLWDGKSATIFPFAPFENVTAPPEVAEDKRLHITTLEGVMVAEIGDYVIKGIKGEIYPCKPDIFAATYELVEAAMPVTPSPESAWPFPKATAATVV